ncbi:MAG: hypothetical protein FJW20_16115 [Acidimicrobiia bacterium]|nr:hypothetical protein [Acidimicrobiia bacterium]
MKKNLSTGPRTPEGKAISSQNARTHGLASAGLFIPPGMEMEFQMLRVSLFQNILPETGLEEFHFNRYLIANWNLHRAELRLAELAAQNADPFSSGRDKSLDDEYDRVMRYRTRYEGTARTCLRELKFLQSTRHLSRVLPDQSNKPERPKLANPTQTLKLANRTHPKPDKDDWKTSPNPPADPDRYTEWMFARERLRKMPPRRP